MRNIKNDFMLPITVLAASCLLISAALALINHVTAPMISQAAEERAEQARMEVLPTADSFEQLALSGLPESVKQVYRATNGEGFVIMLTVTGYGGEMDLLCGISASGNITACKCLEHSETAGLGSMVAEDAFQNQFTGKSKDLAGVSAISGATISSRAYINAVKDALKAFETIKKE